MKTARRGIAGFAAAALAATGLSVLSVATTPTAHADPAEDVSVDAATLTWGLNGYAQKGIFGPWTFKDLTGNVTQLTGSVSGGSQTEYAVAPVPTTSMPVSDPQKTPNAVKFTAGTGTTDPETGAVDVAWDGSYTVNAYPAIYNAPNEVYSDPELTLDGDGNGELTMNFALGEGVDMGGNPTPAHDFGRLTLLTFSDGAVDETAYGAFRATPDYQGVTVTVPDGSAQNTTCTADGGATGWWGSWPQEFINAIPGSVRPHFYSTGCGGNQDLKPALPVNVDLGIEEPQPEQAQVQVSQAEFLPSGSYQVTVSGSGFDPALATGTRPPLSGRAGGTYVVFGKFAETWQPSAGAPSSSRKNSSQKWAVLAEDMATIGGSAGGAVELESDGTFEATVTVDKAAIDAVATDPTLVNYGIYTYPGSGAVQPLYETYTPVTFAKSASATAVQVTRAPTPTAAGSATVSVDPAVDGAVATGDVQVQLRSSTGALVATTSAALTDGSTTVVLPKRLPGSYSLLATYAGDADVAGSSKTVSVKVAKVASTVRGAWIRKPTGARAGGIRIAVAAPGVKPTGVVTVTVRNARGKVVTSVRVRLNADSAAAVALPRLPRGTYRLTATYAGTSQVTPGTWTLRFTTTRR